MTRAESEKAETEKETEERPKGEEASTVNPASEEESKPGKEGAVPITGAVVKEGGGAKKRTADRQITKDDSEEETNSSASGSFPRASADTLKKRRIVKAVDPSTRNADKKTKENGGIFQNPFASTSLPPVKNDGFKISSSEGEKKSNPFAGVALSKPSSGFGADSNKTSTLFGSSAPFAGGFGAASSTTFGSGANASKGFGAVTATATAKSSVFGSALSPAPTSASSQQSTQKSQPPTSIFGTKPPTSATIDAHVHDEKDKNDSDGKGAVDLGVTSTPSNGEEGWECTHQVRAKLFKRVASSSAPKNGNGETSSQSNDLVKSTDHSVPSTSDANQKPSKKEGKDEDIKSADKEKVTSDKESDAAAAIAIPQSLWKEVGTGPVRILSRKRDDDSSSLARIVQRRESTPGGPGTKLILNSNLHKDCHVSRESDKYVKFITLEETSNNVDGDGGDDGKTGKTHLSSVVYLFKVKTVADATALQDHLSRGIKSVTTTSTSSNDRS